MHRMRAGVVSPAHLAAALLVLLADNIRGSHSLSMINTLEFCLVNALALVVCLSTPGVCCYAAAAVQRKEERRVQQKNATMLAACAAAAQLLIAWARQETPTLTHRQRRLAQP
jgi:hypothetical protein